MANSLKSWRDSIFEKVRDAFETASQDDVRCHQPTTTDTVFHLTDADGINGILTSRSIWASLATAMNDAREVQYGIDLAKEAIRQAGQAETQGYERALLAFLDDPTSTPVQIERLPFVVSFCGRPDKSSQWLHYGRSGRGVAVGFDWKIGKSARFDLVKVDYEPFSQIARLKTIVDSVKPILVESLSRLPKPSVMEVVDRLAAQYGREAVSTWAAFVKHPSFCDEDEYRLVGHRLTGDGKSYRNVPKVRFRSSNNRLIPYEGFRYRSADLKEVILGYSSPISEESMKLLLRETGHSAKVSRSSVPLR